MWRNTLCNDWLAGVSKRAAGTSCSAVIPLGSGCHMLYLADLTQGFCDLELKVNLQASGYLS